MNHAPRSVAVGRDVGMAELGDFLGISSGSCTILVNRLEKAGHLRREPDPTDRRRINVVVTDPTRQVLHAARRMLDVAVEKVCADFEPGEQRSIHRFLTAVAQSYSDVALDEVVDS